MKSTRALGRPCYNLALNLSWLCKHARNEILVKSSQLRSHLPKPMTPELTLHLTERAQQIIDRERRPVPPVRKAGGEPFAHNGAFAKLFIFKPPVLESKQKRSSGHVYALVHSSLYRAGFVAAFAVASAASSSSMLAPLPLSMAALVVLRSHRRRQPLQAMSMQTLF